jgi:hypothetical protein
MSTKYNYAPIAATAKRLIDKFGRTTTRKVITNTGTEWNPTQTETASNLVGAFVNFSKNEIDGTLILATDKKLLTYDEVLMTDVITDDSIDYVVKNVDTVNPGDTKIIYKVQLRR